MTNQTLTSQEKKDKTYLNNSPTVTRERFTTAYTVDTEKISSVERFVEAVKSLGGWVDGEVVEYQHFYNKHTSQSVKFYTLTASVPKAV